MAGQLQEQNRNADVTANVPSEVLCLVFSHISSFRHKFRLAAVNKKFRECTLREMNKPVPLDVKMLLPPRPRDSKYHYLRDMHCYFNGTKINRTLDCLDTNGQINSRFYNAVQALAAACKFNKITITVGSVNQEHQYRLFQILVDTDCLNQLTTFEQTGSGYDGCLTNCITKVLVRCDQLSVLKLGSSISYNPDFTEALKNKHLTGLVLTLYNYTQQQVIELFQALKPNMLRKLQLTYHQYRETSEGDPLMFSELVKQMRSSWMTLEEIHFGGFNRLPLPELFRMFEALASLPSLQICHVKWFRSDLVGPPTEFTAALTSLFNLSGVAKNLTLELNRCRNISGCWFVGLIDRVKKRHPALRIEVNRSDFKLVVGAVSIIMSVDRSSTECSNEACVPCKQCYPNVVYQLWRKSTANADCHVEDYQLDRCKGNKVVVDYNERYHRRPDIRAMQANEEQDRVTVTFEANGQLFYYITINTGHCFDNSCIRCLQID